MYQQQQVPIATEQCLKKRFPIPPGGIHLFDLSVSYQIGPAARVTFPFTELQSERSGSAKWLCSEENRLHPNPGL